MASFGLDKFLLTNKNIGLCLCMYVCIYLLHKTEDTHGMSLNMEDNGNILFVN